MGLCESTESRRKKSRVKSRTMKMIPIGAKSHKISEEDIKQLSLKYFDKYDASGDGNLNRRELTAFFDDIIERRKREGK